MSVSNGNKANATTFNAAFVSRTVDTSTVGKIDLTNADAASGSSITNVQRELNGQASFTGDTTGNAENRTPTWSSDAIGTANQPIKNRVDSVQAAVETNQTNIAGKIDGAGSSTDNALARWDGAAGDALQDSGIIIDDTDNITGVNNLTVDGDLTVNGTTTTIDTATLDVTDANITVNNGGTQANADANDAGITVEMSDATDTRIGYDSTLASRFMAGDVGAEEEIITSGHSQIITSKDIDLSGTASATNRVVVSSDTTANLDSLARKKGVIYFDDTENTYKGDDGTNLIDLGGGGSGFGVNFIEQFDAESTDISDWTSFDDGAVDTPVDGTGGSPSAISVARTTTGSEVLIGTASFKISKTAADGQGEGVSVDFTTDGFFDEKELEIEIPYSTTANYADDDIGIFLYDVTNAQLITLTQFELGVNNGLVKAGTNKTFRAVFAASDSNSYRLIIHVRTTSALAYDFIYDNVIVGPRKSTAGGAVISEWQDYTPTTQGLGTPTFNEARYRRVGSSLEIQIEMQPGTVTASEAQIGLPSGFEILNAIGTPILVGSGEQNNASAAGDLVPLATGSDTFLNFGNATSGGATKLTPVTGTAGFISGERYSFFASVPIEGLAASIPGTGNGAIITEWEDYTPGTQGFGSPTINRARFRRVGSNAEISINITAGTTDSSEAQVDLPTGLTVDNGLGGLVLLGPTYQNSASAGNPISVLATGGDTFLNFGNATSGGGSKITPGTGSASFITSGEFSFTVSVPINGWSSNAATTFKPAENLSVTSSAKTPGASNDYLSMTGNSVTLTRGTWMLNGQIDFGNAGACAYTLVQCGWYTANGTDTGSEPATLQASLDAGFYRQILPVPSNDESQISASSVRITVNTDTTVFLVPRATIGTPGNARVTSYVYAERIA